jgi:hypothetical protein
MVTGQIWEASIVGRIKDLLMVGPLEDHLGYTLYWKVKFQALIFDLSDSISPALRGKLGTGLVTLWVVIPIPPSPLIHIYWKLILLSSQLTWCLKVKVIIVLLRDDPLPGAINELVRSDRENNGVVTAAVSLSSARLVGYLELWITSLLVCAVALPIMVLLRWPTLRQCMDNFPH